MKLSQLWLPITVFALLALSFGCNATQSSTPATDANAQLEFYVSNGSQKLMDRLKEHKFPSTPIDVKSSTGKLIKALLGAKSDEFLIVLNPIINRPLAVIGINDKTDWASIESALEKIDTINQNGPKSLPRLQPERKDQAKLVLISDYQCSHCQRMETVVDEWKTHYGKNLVVDFVNFPLPGHPQAQPAAQAAECVRKNGDFDAYQRLLFANQKKLTPSLYFDFAKKVGANPKAFKKCLESGETIETVKNDMAFANFMVVRGTPTLFLNGELLEGMTQQELEAKLDSLLKKPTP